MKILFQKILVVFLLLMSMSTISFAQLTFARTVSRANCLVPTYPLLSIRGLTFNESISWNPKFWNKHYVTVKSEHRWVQRIGGVWWDDRLMATYSAGSFYNATWRVWAGTVRPWNEKTIVYDPRGYRYVEGTHRERFPNRPWIYNNYTFATDCNITKW